MPPVAVTAASTGSGDYAEGDTRAHMFRIDRTKNPAEMFYTSGSKTCADSFMAVNYACLYCHDGTDAVYLTVDAAKTTPALIHEP